MDEEIKQIQLDILNELRALREQGASSSLGGGRKITKDPTKVIEDATDAVDEFGDELVILGVSTRNLNRAQIDQLKAAAEYKKNLETQTDALRKGTDSVKAFGQALLNTERSFGKYGKAIEGITAETGKFLSTMGPLAKGIGATIYVLGKLSTVYLEQADRLLKANDTIAQFGTAGSFTTKELMEMAHGAGVTSKNMELLTKPIASLGPALINLGGTTGEGVKAFANLTKITSEQREEYQRLGISQEQLIQNQADYIQLQRLSGKVISTEVKDRAALQKASLDYTDNLLQLSAISGQDLQTVKQKQQLALQENNFMISNMRMQQKADDLRAKGDAASIKEAERIKQEIEMRKKLVSAVAANLDDQARLAFTARLATGTYTEHSKGLAILGVDMAKHEKKMREGGDATGDVLNEMSDKLKTVGVAQLGQASVFNKELSDTVLTTSKNLQFATAGVKDYNEALNKAKGDIDKATKPGTDPAQNARAKLTTAEIAVQKALDNLVASTNPLIDGFDAVKVAAWAAAGALGAIAIARGASLLAGMAGTGKAAVDAARKAATALPGTGGIIGSGGRPMPTPAPVPGGRPMPTPAPVPGGPLAGKGIPAGAGAGAAAGPGKIATGVENLIGALGKGAGAALAGAAKGLEAFANPMVLPGAAKLSAAIAVIGAGIAGATWIMGKALPTLAEGLEPFAKLDGDKLSKTGKGVADLGSGLAVFAAGGVAAGVGSAITSVSEGINKLFGAKTPLEKLEEFVKLSNNIDPERTEKLAQAFLKYAQSMSMLSGQSSFAKSTNRGSPFTIQRGVTASSAASENSNFGLPQAADQLTNRFTVFSGLLEKSSKDLENLTNTFGKLDENLKQNLTKNIPTEFGDAMSSLSKTIPKRVDESMDELDSAMHQSFDSADNVRKSLKAGIVDAARLRNLLQSLAEPDTDESTGATAQPSTPPPSVPPSAPSAPSAPSGTTAPISQDVQKNLAGLKSVLSSRGIKDENYINAILGNVMKETGGLTRAENLNYSNTSNERIRRIFGSRAASKSDLELNQIKSSPESMAEFMYGKDTGIGRGMGNTEPGDGWKYRGRGYIQLTGKNNYANASTAIFGDDRLVKNPELANDPKVAAEITAWYMQKTKTSSLMGQLGISSGPLSREQANQLATSQIAGRAIQRGETGYLAQTLSKVDVFSSQIANIQASLPQTGEIQSSNGNRRGPKTQVQAAKGAVIDGPMAGYPVDLTAHGREIIAPLQPNSILEMLSKTAVSPTTTEPIKPAIGSGDSNTEALRNLISMQEEMISVLSSKMDTMIDELSRSNYTQDKLLQTARV